MPRETFFNLQEEKKERILETAIEEFAEQGFRNANISRIVEKAGIAKGSFYQYFEDKLDLFKYIIQITGEMKLNYMSHILNDMNGKGVFDNIRELYLAGIQFAKDHPKLAMIGDHIYKNKEVEFKDILPKEMIAKGNQVFESILHRGIERGEIDPKIDVKLVSHLISSMNLTIMEYSFNELNVSDYGDIMDTFDKLIYVFENGIKNKERRD